MAPQPVPSLLIQPCSLPMFSVHLYVLLLNKDKMTKNPQDKTNAQQSSTQPESNRTGQSRVTLLLC